MATTAPLESPSGNVEPSLPPVISTSKETDAQTPKIDKITALQDSIDKLSLAMFEALRGLRDAVAPESGNLGVSSHNAAAATTTESSDAGDFDEFYQSYKAGDEKAIALVKRASGGSLPQKREDLIRIHAKMEMEKDTELVARLASTVLQRSAEVDERVTTLPGMHRTRTEQMKRIEELLELNRQVANELEEAYASARGRRDDVRAELRDKTCRALGIEED